MFIFWKYYLENKKTIFPTGIPVHVYAAILEFSRNDDLFPNRQKLLCQINWKKNTKILFTLPYQTIGNQPTELLKIGHFILE